MAKDLDTELVDTSHRFYKLLNDRYFGGKLPKKQIAWLPGLKFWGDVNGTIRLSLDHHKSSYYDIRDTMLHEMIHIKLKNGRHNQKFRKEAKRVGIKDDDFQGYRVKDPSGLR